MCGQSVTGQSFRGNGPFVFTVCTSWLSVAWQQLGLTPGQHCIKSGAPCLCRWNTTLIKLTCVCLLLKMARLPNCAYLSGPRSLAPSHTTTPYLPHSQNALLCRATAPGWVTTFQYFPSPLLMWQLIDLSPVGIFFSNTFIMFTMFKVWGQVVFPKIVKVSSSRFETLSFVS